MNVALMTTYVAEQSESNIYVGIDPPKPWHRWEKDYVAGKWDVSPIYLSGTSIVKTLALPFVVVKRRIYSFLLRF